MQAKTAMKRKPMKKRARKAKPGDNAAYLDWIRGLPCLICYADVVKMFGVEALTCNSAVTTEAAHVGRRGLGQKCADLETVPLCMEHHRTGPEAHHVLGKAFWDFHGLDCGEVVEQLNAMYERAAV
jgi:hypothetical protein